MKKTALSFAIACISLSACSTLQSLNPFDNSPTLTKLAPATVSAVNARWQSPLGANAAPGLAPAFAAGVIYAAGIDGTIIGVNETTGASVMRAKVEGQISGGVATNGALIAVGTTKGQVIAIDITGAKKWATQVKSAVISPPTIADGVVIAISGDGTITGLDATNGAVKWTIPRTLPALTVRNNAGMVVTRRAGILGTAGGRLIAFDTVTGVMGWESVVATPKGTTELDRIADVVSLPVVDDRVACVTAFQGRTGCFDLLRGTTVWVRDISSRYGLAMEGDSIFVTDDKHVLHALDKTTGASLWKQDALAGRKISAPQVLNGKLLTFDHEGYAHLLDAKKGDVLGRSLAEANPPVHQPIVANGALVWLTAKGGLISTTLK